MEAASLGTAHHRPLVQREPSVFQLQEALPIVLVLQASLRIRMDLVWMLMSVLEIVVLAVLALSVLMNLVLTPANALLAMKGILIMVPVLLHNKDVPRILNAVRMRNVSNLVNVCANRLFSLIQKMEISVRALAKGTRVDSMPSAHQVTHHSACVSLVMKEIHTQPAWTLMNANRILVELALLVSILRVASDVYVPRD